MQNLKGLKGKVALITGSARRIGAITARMLHDNGATVIIHYRNSSADAKKLCDELNKVRPNSCFTEKADLLDVSSFPLLISSIVKKVGRLDILINNASSFYPTTIGEITEENWNDLMGSNLKAPLFLAQAAATYLKETNGCIVNMADVYGFRPLKEHAVYSVAKAGLIMLTKSLAKELGPNIRVNGIAPGAILWPEAEEENTAEQQILLDKTCLKREGTPEDIAKAILFLVRDADYITGHILPVDGGRTVNQ